jgi:ATP dependent DNA ligase-like protein
LLEDFAGRAERVWTRSCSCRLNSLTGPGFLAIPPPCAFGARSQSLLQRQCISKTASENTFPRSGLTRRFRFALSVERKSRALRTVTKERVGIHVLLTRSLFGDGILRRLLPPVSLAREELLQVARQFQLEGLIAKRPDSVYEPGRRCGAWVKAKLTQQQEFVIGGYTPPDGSRKYFGSLIVGYHLVLQSRARG